MTFVKTERFPGEGFYTAVPTHWLRDPRLTATAKAVLSYWQSHAINYRVTIDQTVAEMREGPSAIYAAVKLAISLGYLKRHQPRTPDGRRLAEVTYTYGPAAYEQQYVRNWGPQPGADDDAPAAGDGAGNPAAAPGNPAAGGDDVCPGQSAFRFSATRQSAHRESTTKKDQSLDNQGLENPPLPPAGAPAAAGADAGGEHPEKPTRDALNAAVDAAVAARAGAPGWDVGAVRAVVREQLTAGATTAEVVAALAAAAADRQGTAYPGRLAWWVVHLRQPEVQAPPWAQGARKYLPPGTPTCPRHRGEPAQGCNPCAADAKAADDGTEARLLADRPSATAAVELARRNAAAARSRTRPGPPAPDRGDFTATLARLDQEIARQAASCPTPQTPTPEGTPMPDEQGHHRHPSTAGLP